MFLCFMIAALSFLAPSIASSLGIGDLSDAEKAAATLGFPLCLIVGVLCEKLDDLRKELERIRKKEGAADA